MVPSGQGKCVAFCGLAWAFIWPCFIGRGSCRVLSRFKEWECRCPSCLGGVSRTCSEESIWDGWYGDIIFGNFRAAGYSLLLSFIWYPHCPIFGLWKLLQADFFWVLLTCLPVFWATPLFSGRRHSRIILSLPCSSPEISHFSKEPCFLLRESDI